MSGGKIGGSEAGKNTSANLGGGVYTSGTFTMSGSAEVSYNTAAKQRRRCVPTTVTPSA